MKKKERPVYGFVRRGDTLVPEFDYDLSALQSVRQGETVRVEIKQFRNASRNRAYWAMLHEMVEATDCVLSPERLHEVIKLETGVVDLIRLPNGMTVAIPGSIAFDKMSEEEFVAFFKAAERWLAETYGWAPESERSAA